MQAGHVELLCICHTKTKPAENSKSHEDIERIHQFFNGAADETNPYQISPLTQ